MADRKPDEIYQIGKVDNLSELVEQLNAVLFEISKRLHPPIDFHYREDIDHYDFTLADFTTDGKWHDLDLSPILPSNARLAFVYLHVQDNAAGNYVEIRKFGQVNEYNALEITTNVANYDMDQEGILEITDSRKLEYKASNTTFTEINLIIRGYWTW